jgi:hypothetical protein
MSRSRWRRAAGVSGLAACSLAAGSVGLAMAHGAGQRTPTATHSQSQARRQTAPGGASGATWMEQFPTIRRGLAAGAVRGRPLSTKLQMRAASAAASAFGRHLKLSVDDSSVVQGSKGWQLAIVPGQDGACIVANFPATSTSPDDGPMSVTECDTAANILQYGLVAAGFNDGSYYLAGMVPASNSAVTVETGAGSQVSLPVSASGTVMQDFASQPRSLTIHNGEGIPTTMSYGENSGAPAAAGGA